VRFVVDGLERFENDGFRVMAEGVAGNSIASDPVTAAAAWSNKRQCPRVTPAPSTGRTMGLVAYRPPSTRYSISP